MSCSQDNPALTIPFKWNMPARANVLHAAAVQHDETRETVVVFAHGAGANMDSPFMLAMAEGLAASGITVVRFNFLYMQANAEDGKRRPPDRAPKLLAHFSAVLEQVCEQVISKAQLHQSNPLPPRIILMGKSMGGRMAATLAGMALTPHEVNVPAGLTSVAIGPASSHISAVVCLGYPFVPLKGGEPRLEPLQTCPVPVCIVQGERDKFGGLAQVPDWPLPREIVFHWIADGCHSFIPRKSSGTTENANLAKAVEAVVEFIGGLDA